MTSLPMARGLSFAELAPREAAVRLDSGSVHLWRIAHVRAQGRAPLRSLLAAYLDVPEAAVELTEGARGKPMLANEHDLRGGVARLEFNWSHSGDFALVAIARGIAPGVDIERHHARTRALALAQRFFDPDESATLARLEGDARDRAFLSLWCAKEAVLKATGEGLSFGLDRLAFRGAGAGWRLARMDPTLGTPSEWQLAGFDAAPGYHGALAWRGNARTLVAFSPPPA